MRAFLVIGLGRFGRHLALGLMKIDGNEVMVLDRTEELVSEIAPMVTKAQIGDGTKIDVLRSIGINTFDACFVCMGASFQSSLETTALLKDLGARKVISKASTAIQEKFLLRNGADEVVYPERDAAEKLAHRYSMNRLRDFLELTPEVSIFEVECAPAWVGKSIAELNFRARYNANILAIKSNNDIKIPGADYVFSEGENIMLMGKNEEIDKLLKKIK